MNCRNLNTTTLLVATMMLLAQLQAQAAQQPATVIATPAPSADNPLQLKADHVTISVADIDKVQAWYVDVLGFKEFGRGNEANGLVHRELRIPGVFRVDLSWRKGSARHTVGKPSDMEQGWRHLVFKTPELDHALQWLHSKQVDVRVIRNPKDNAILMLFMTDPEGNEIELQSMSM